MKCSVVCVGIVLVLAASASKADWVYGLGFDFSYDDNITLGDMPQDLKPDSMLSVSAAPAYHWYSEKADRLTLGSSLHYAKSQRFSGLDHWQIGLDLAYRKKLSMGRDAKAVESGMTITYRDAHDSFRDGWEFSGFLGGIVPISERVNVALFSRFKTFESRETQVASPFIQARGLKTDVFDTRTLDVSFLVDFFMSEKWLLMFEYKRQRGDVSSVVMPNFDVLNASVSAAPDLVFGAGWIAYRIDADVNIISIGASYELSRHLSVDWRLVQRNAASPGGVNYDSRSSSLGLNYVL